MLEPFIEYLRDQGKQFTQQRKQIVNLAFSLRVFSAEELIRAADPTIFAISRPTVYRTLTELVDAGLFDKLPSSRGVRYARR